MCSLVCFFVLSRRTRFLISHAPDFAQCTSGTGTQAAITKTVSGKEVGKNLFFCPQLSVKVLLVNTNILFQETAMF